MHTPIGKKYHGLLVCKDASLKDIKNKCKDAGVTVGKFIPVAVPYDDPELEDVLSSGS